MYVEGFKRSHYSFVEYFSASIASTTGLGRRVHPADHGYQLHMYFNMTPVDFFAPLGTEDSPYSNVCERLCSLDNSDPEKVSTFLDWIAEQKNTAK